MSSTTLATRRTIRLIAVIAMPLSSHRPPLRPYLNHRRKTPGTGSYECPNSSPASALGQVIQGVSSRRDHIPANARRLIESLQQAMSGRREERDLAQ